MQDITNEITYPTEITFKAILRDSSSTLDSIKSILLEKKINGAIYTKPSSHKKFTSYTITAIFPSKECLNLVCNEITTLEGYMTMF